MASQRPIDIPIDKPDLSDHGLNLNSSSHSFVIAFSPTATFDPPHTITLSKSWTDNMGLHLLQRSMLPARVLRCMLTLNGVLKISESYGPAIRRSLSTKTSDLVLEHLSEQGDDFLLQLRLVTDDKKIVLEEHFEPGRFKLGRLARREIEARGFQLTPPDSGGSELLISKCRYLRILVKEWKCIRDVTEFSPEAVQTLGPIGTGEIGGGVAERKHVECGMVEENETAKGAENPCACYRENDRVGLTGGTTHGDVCGSQWAALFSQTAVSATPKKTADEGLQASRWA